MVSIGGFGELGIRQVKDWTVPFQFKGGGSKLNSYLNGKAFLKAFSPWVGDLPNWGFLGFTLFLIPGEIGGFETAEGLQHKRIFFRPGDLERSLPFRKEPKSPPPFQFWGGGTFGTLGGKP